MAEVLFEVEDGKYPPGIAVEGRDATPVAASLRLSPTLNILVSCWSQFRYLVIFFVI